MYQFKGGLVTTSLLDLLDCIAILLLLCQISCFWYTVVCDCEILMLCPRNLMKGICKTLWGGIIWMIIWFLLIFSPFFGIDASLKYFKLCQNYVFDFLWILVKGLFCGKCHIYTGSTRVLPPCNALLMGILT